MNRKTASFLIVLFFLITYILPIVIISKEENLNKKEGLDILRNPNIDDDFVASDGGIVDRDLNRNGKLGIAKYFHIFANTVALSADVSGNVAAGKLKANSNFGTKIHESKLNLDISYIQEAEFIQSSSFISANSNRKNKVIFGENVTLTLVDNGNKVAANNCNLDHLSKDEIYQDKNGCKYIDFNNEFKNLKKSSDEMKIEKQTIGVVKNFTDENNRYFDVSNIQSSEKGAVILNKTDESGNKLDGVKFNLYKEGERDPIKTNLTTNNGKIIVLNLDEGNYKFKEVETLQDYILDSSEHKFTISSYNIGSSNTIYLELTKEEIEKARPITIKGIDKNGPNIIVNVDTENSKNINVCAEIKLIYSDETERNNHETEDFSDAQVLWNFINRANDQVININQARFQGSILAVGSTINIGQNVDGCIIADTVNINGGESHRWDFQEKNGSNKKDVELTLVNKKKDPDNSLYSIRLIKLDSTYLPYSVSTSLVKSQSVNFDSDSYNPYLKGAKFKLVRDSDNVIIGEYETDDDGEIFISNIPKDNYTLIETKAPYGYVLDNEQIKVEEKYFDYYKYKVYEVIAYNEKEEISIPIEKKWKGDELREVIVYLKANGNRIKELKLSKLNNWKATFDDLYLIDEYGQKINYSIEEEKIDGYECVIKQNDVGNLKKGFTITNYKIPDEPSEPDEEYIKINVEKKWEGKVLEGKNVKVKLFANGKEVVGKLLILSKNNEWKGSFSNLPKYDNDKNEVIYDIKEEPIAGYISEVIKDNARLEKTYWMMIKAPYDLESGKNYLIAVQDWTIKDGSKYYFLSDVGNDERVGLREFDAANAFIGTHNGKIKEEIEFGNKSYREYVDLTKTNYSENNIENIWLYNKNNGIETLKNKSTSNYITLKGENKYPIRYSFITSKKEGWKQKENFNFGVNYSRNLDLAPGAAGIMCTISSAQLWGNPLILYPRQYMSLHEGRISQAIWNLDWAGHFKFFKKIKENIYNYTIINKENPPYIPPYEPEDPPTRDIEAEKWWADIDGTRITAPVEKIEVELYRDGIATGKIIELNEQNNWRGAFRNLEVSKDKYSINYVYTVREVGENKSLIKLDGEVFKVYYSGSMRDGFKITNEKTPPTPYEPPLTKIKVRKNWKDSEGNFIEPAKQTVKVELYENGIPTGLVVELKLENNWTATFENLLLFENENGPYKQYSIKEMGEENGKIIINEEEYEVNYKGSMEYGFEITNTKIPEKPEEPIEAPKDPPIPQKPQTPQKPILPKTGDGINRSTYMVCMAVIGIIMLLIGIRRRKYEARRFRK